MLFREAAKGKWTPKLVSGGRWRAALQKCTFSQSRSDAASLSPRATLDVSRFARGSRLRETHAHGGAVTIKHAERINFKNPQCWDPNAPSPRRAGEIYYIFLNIIKYFPTNIEVKDKSTRQPATISGTLDVLPCGLQGTWWKVKESNRAPSLFGGVGRERGHSTPLPPVGIVPLGW